MKLKKRVKIYKVPPIGQFLHACIDESRKGGHRYVVQMLDFREIVALEAKATGRPSKIAYNATTSHIRVWPVPDESYELVVRYYPPAMEI